MKLDFVSQCVRCSCKNLEVEDAGVVVSEALVRRDDSVQQLLVQRQAGDGSEQPAVTCTADS